LTPDRSTQPTDDSSLAPEGERAASWVTDKWKQADTVLMEERRDYWLNSAFFEGDQWVFWSPNNEVAEWHPQGGEGRVKAVVNKIQPNLITNHARLMKRKLVFEVPAQAADDATVHAARLGAHLLEAERLAGDWESIRRVNMMNKDFSGTSAVLVEWNPTLGDPIGVDPETGEVILAGNPQLTPLSITEFTLEPGTMDWHDSRYMIVCKAMTPAQAKELYQLGFMPKPDANQGVGPLQRKLTSKRTGLANAKLCLVYTYYERPSSESEGRHLVVVNGETVIDNPWPFPETIDGLPIYVFRQMAMPKKWPGTTYLNQARPLQTQINAGYSLMIETMKFAGNPRLAIPDTAGISADELTDTPGEILYYDGTSSGPPMYIQPANVPAWMFDHVDRLKNDLDDNMYVHAISRGQAPGDRNSGLALTVLAEKDETPLGLIAQDESAGWSHIGSLVLKLWEANVTEQRKSVVQTAPGAPPLSRYWNGQMLRGQTTAHVPLDAVMPYSRAAQQAWVSQLAQQFPTLPAFQDARLMSRMLDLPDADNLINMIDADAAKAELEHHLISTGEVVLPENFDDHAKHIAEHNRWRKSPAYMYAEPEVRKVMDQHILAHMQMAAEELANQADLAHSAPGMEQVPQDNEPKGSMVPPDNAEQQAPGMGAPQPNPNGFGQAIPQAPPPPENGPLPAPPGPIG